MIGALLQEFLDGFTHPYCPSRREVVLQEKHLRNHLDERQIDKTVEDTFPASDPPSNY
ncbi:MAG: hypothetical protein KGJ06_06365 [Pseudomonadota bacterium]|nr:hypothetical protein [Pseudomonadota bacterium]